jgi:hypothetical protein
MHLTEQNTKSSKSETGRRKHSKPTTVEDSTAKGGLLAVMACDFEEEIHFADGRVIATRRRELVPFPE